MNFIEIKEGELALLLEMAAAHTLLLGESNNVLDMMKTYRPKLASHLRDRLYKTEVKLNKLHYELQEHEEG